MLADTLEAVGIPRGDYVVRINNRKILDGVMEITGLSGEGKAAERGIVLRAIDKLDRLGVDGVRALLGKGREDESGDFTPGAGLSDDQAYRVVQFFDFKAQKERRLNAVSEFENRYGKLPPYATEALLAGDFSNRDIPQEWRDRANEFTLHILRGLVEGSMLGEEGVEELETIADLLAAQGYGPERIVIDPSVVRGLGYYTGPVYEAELTFEILDEKGRPRQFGSVAGGGRYDDLVKRFTGQSVPATGVSIGVDRLLAALRAKGRAGAPHKGPVVITVMDRDRMADYQSMAAELRAAGIRAEVYLGNPKNFCNQLKYADKRHSPVAIIQGSDEAARGVVQIKDLILGAKLAAEATLEEWKSQPAQIEAPRADLVAQVRAILDRHT
jgi:histidyl-tRNA synthetase